MRQCRSYAATHDHRSSKRPRPRGACVAGCGVVVAVTSGTEFCQPQDGFSLALRRPGGAVSRRGSSSFKITEVTPGWLLGGEGAVRRSWRSSPEDQAGDPPSAGLAGHPTRADRALLTALSRSLPQRGAMEVELAPKVRAVAARGFVPRVDLATRPGDALRIQTDRRRAQGSLGIVVSATSVRTVLLEAGLRPAPQRTHSSWRSFVRAQAASMLASDFSLSRPSCCNGSPGFSSSRWRAGVPSTSPAAPTRMDARSPSRRVTSSCCSAASRLRFSSTIATQFEFALRLRFGGGQRANQDHQDTDEGVERKPPRHDSEHRPHRALQLFPPAPRDPTPLTAPHGSTSTRSARRTNPRIRSRLSLRPYEPLDDVPTYVVNG